MEDSLQYLVDGFVEWRRHTDTALVLREAVETMDTLADHEAALQILAAGIIKIAGTGNQGTRDVDLTQNTEDRWADYQRLTEAPDGMLGIPTGFPTIDLATAGLQGGQLITIIASPKTGKSVLGLQMAVNMHELWGCNPVFQSFEMSNREQQTRHDAMRAHISHNRLRRGQLKQPEVVRYRAALDKMKSMQPITLTDAVGGTTVSALDAKIEKYKPNILFIDGVYLMTDEQSGETNTPQALTNITRALKALAQRRDIPIVITTQTLLWKMKKGRSVSADSIGYSSSFFQDSDVIIGLERTEDDDEMVRILKIVESRNCGKVEVDLMWNWEEGRFLEQGGFEGKEPAGFTLDDDGDYMEALARG